MLKSTFLADIEEKRALSNDYSLKVIIFFKRRGSFTACSDSLNLHIFPICILSKHNFECCSDNGGIRLKQCSE